MQSFLHGKGGFVSLIPKTKLYSYYVERFKAQIGGLGIMFLDSVACIMLNSVKGDDFIERQLKRAFKSRTPKQKRLHASRVARSVRRISHTLGGVMIVPLPPGSERLIDQEIKKIRAGYIREMGQVVYNNHVKKVNEEFKTLMASRGVRV